MAARKQFGRDRSFSARAFRSIRIHPRESLEKKEKHAIFSRDNATEVEKEKERMAGGRDRCFCPVSSLDFSCLDPALSLSSPHQFVYIFLLATATLPRSRTPLTGKCDLPSALNIFSPMQKIIGEYITSLTCYSYE